MTKTKLPVKVDNVIGALRSAMGPDFISDLEKEFTYPNPEAAKMRRLVANDPYKYRYTKMPPDFIKTITIGQKAIYLPRGAIGKFKEICERHDMQPEFIDRRISFGKHESVAVSPSLTLRPYQGRVLGEAVMAQEGVIVAPCGAGKTVIGGAILAMLGEPTLIIVHTNELLKQWKDELADKAILPEPVGQYAGGQKKLRHVTVATVQTLVRMEPEKLIEFIDSFGCVILDECHHVPATTFMNVFNMCPARYRFGLTATDKRRDGLHILMRDVIGDVIAEITDADLVTANRLQTCQVQEVKTGFLTHRGLDDWVNLTKELTTDAARNMIIVDNVVQSWHDGHFPLVLSDRVAHCNYLCAALRARGMNAQMLVGNVPPEMRAQTMEQARKNMVDAIVGTSVADEGLDIDTLSCIHLTCPTQNIPKLKQRVGRIRRHIEGKTAVIYDYVDWKVVSLSKMAKARRKFYLNASFELLQTNSAATGS